MDTIFALATAQGRSGVAVVRISGPGAFTLAQGLCGALPPPRKASLRDLKDSSGSLLDQALVVTFEAPNSFTGEDVVELHLHGSIAVVQAVLDQLQLNENVRLAEAGEFTRRALENEKLDLSQVEGLADLIDSETEAQRKQAVRILSGALGDKVETWRSKLIRSAALLEATIDFADEDVPVDVSPEVSALLTGVLEEVETEVNGSIIAERIQSGFEVAIVGPPNAGKSTLLNRLAGREAAITSEVAGTTRDVIEVRMDLAGLPVTFLDTAGLRESEDEVEAIGIQRALERGKSADLRVFLVPDGADLPLPVLQDDIVLTPKVDLLGSHAQGISGLTGHGVSELVERIQRVFSSRSMSAGIATRARHRVAMARAVEDLTSALSIVSAGSDTYDIAAEELRSAIRALESLVGRIDVENLLDEIFSSFCLGK